MSNVIDIGFDENVLILYPTFRTINDVNKYINELIKQLRVILNIDEFKEFKADFALFRLDGKTIITWDSSQVDFVIIQNLTSSDGGSYIRINSNISLYISKYISILEEKVLIYKFISILLHDYLEKDTLDIVLNKLNIADYSKK